LSAVTATAALSLTLALLLGRCRRPNVRSGGRRSWPSPSRAGSCWSGTTPLFGFCTGGHW